ncbi:hypothetical protein NSK_002153 [Nannochloropsis salina CCMP1776]|uniref:Uncharacterized protein n=1 Tax=Nannochloropsis salina CCMP1776 TaxID=1027361 RepID=A0A4D9D555_9STRA|nr:hypothetical protein NSK_002153 [Nannochloropsis salina CCMP1776]|eukprot:TFJ86496.1 hypothetical protein NSK_002153 [Nannochloropsis salina CCMP1776]
MENASAQTPTARMKHLRTLFVDKYLESSTKHLCTTDIPEAFGDLKSQLDGPSFNILMTMVKEKMQALGPFAHREFQELCTELGLEDKFRQVEAEISEAATHREAASRTKGRRKARPGRVGMNSTDPQEQFGNENCNDSVADDMPPEDLARHRRMVIKRKELAELRGMQEREVTLLRDAEESLKATKDKMRAVYHDMSSLAPEAQRLLQRCTEN